jgi:integrase
MPKYRRDINHIVSLDEAKAMMVEAGLKSRNPERDKFIVGFLYLIGCRPVELLKRINYNSFRHIDELGQFFEVVVPTAKLRDTAKFGIRQRTLEINRESPFSLEITHYVLSFKNTPEAPLVNISSRRLHYIIGTLSKDQFTPYNFRHSRITKILGSGATVSEAMYWKGAKRVSSIDPYISAKPIGRRIILD